MFQPVDSALYEELARKVASLRRPEAFPEPTDTVETVETHMAWVFLTNTRAYKLKKPLHTRYFDHTTPQARRHACNVELELNRRLAPHVYMAVVPVSKAAGGFRVDGGIPVDWMVKMQRLPRSRVLERLIESGQATDDHIDAVSHRLAKFYRHADSAGFSPIGYRRRLQEDIDAKTLTLRHPRYGLDPAVIDETAARSHGWLDEHVHLIEERATTVVDAHGDLRPEHIFMLDANPVIIDCLEFERSLRLLDPVSELSFLALECDRLDAEWVGHHLLNGYRNHSDDRFPTEVIPFYKAYHALIRATVAIWHIDDEMLDESDKWRRKATSYLRTATAILSAGSPASSSAP